MALDFEVMCNASDYAVGAVMGQRKNKNFHVIHYASKVLNEAQINYATTEKQLLADMPNFTSILSKIFQKLPNL